MTYITVGENEQAVGPACRSLNANRPCPSVVTAGGMEGASGAAPPGVGRGGVVGCASTRAPAIGSPVPACTTIPAITPPGGCCSDWVENVWKIIIHPIATTSLMSTPGHFRLSVQHLWARYIKVSVVVGRAGGELLRLESIWRLSSLRTRSSERPRGQTYVLMHMIIEELKSPLRRRLH